MSPMGRTQAEKRYILETVLEHLPIVTGSERDMNVHIVQKAGHDSSSSCDEFEMNTNNLKDSCGDHSYEHGWRHHYVPQRKKRRTLSFRGCGFGTRHRRY